MALKKSIQTEFGVPVEHWVIISYSYDYIGRVVSATLAGYVNATAFNAGANYLVRENLGLDKTNFVADMTRENMYALIKLLPKFSGAIDA